MKTELRHLLLATLATGALLTAGCASERLYREGVGLVDAGQYEEGLARLQEAAKESPRDLQYRTALQRQREAIVVGLGEQSEQARREGRMEDAESLVRRARSIDPASTRLPAIAERIARDRTLLVEMRAAERLSSAGKLDEAAEKLNEIALLNPEIRGLAELRKRVDSARLAKRTTSPLIKARQGKPISLQFRDAALRTVLEALSRDTGINFILDKDVRADTRVTIFVQQVRIEDAIDLILTPAQLDRKIVSENTLLVYPATQAKQKEHQELLLRSFYVKNADIKQTTNLLKTMLKIKDVFMDERVNLLVIRDTPDIVRMAERLIEAHDVPEPEVMLEVEVLEISRTNETNIGAKFPETLTLRDGNLVNKLNSSVQINLKSVEGKSNLLSNPRIRVKSRQKARVVIGERVPVISSTTTPTTNGTTPALVSQQIQYLDIGLKLEVEPVVNLDDSVSIKLGLEVNTLGEKIETQTGAVAYRVGTRTTSTVLELKDGETQVLAGLIRDDDRRTANRLPGIGEFPLLDRLFGTVSTEGSKTEIVLSITPRMIRTVRRADVNVQESWSGTEANFRDRPLMAAPLGTPAQGSAPQAPAAAYQAAPAQPGLALPARPVPGVVGAPLPAGAPGAAVPTRGPVSAAQPALVTSQGALPAASGAPSPAASTGSFAASWSGPASSRAGSEFTITLSARASAPVSSAAFQFQFDPTAIEVLSVEEGGLFRQGGETTTFNQTVDPSGRIYAGVARPSGRGITGSGVLAVIKARPRPGSKEVSINPVTLTPIGPDGRPVNVDALGPYQVQVSQ